ncbi:PREDICTED: X-ray repair cross-complementing protein 6-like [Dufourea novaeangliae]|uniref:X-ray repair cross-complementing protein 6-like n=1 Tax=Dufourea novaeangliae TaxID=178035 RepID=UPI000766F2EC|nr:PREDICTED: X-ray repair cross-complementing protein 6-like [Dufourea novaeangliae]
MDFLKPVMKIDEEGEWEYYRNIASSATYPLHDVLWHAASIFSAINITMPKKRVILFTCQDNPPMTNNDEKRRIIVKAKSFNDIGLQLNVVGLGKNWNHDLFYKDLEMSSEKIDSEDYKRTSLDDIVQQVKLPSRNMASLPWRLGENVIVDVTVRNFASKRAYLQKQAISKATNVPLTLHTYLTVKDSDNKNEDDECDKPPTPVLETEIQKYQQFGGKEIYFTPAEVKSLCTTREPGIDLICVKPIFYHPMYHFGIPYFVTPSKSTRKDNNLLFAALVDKCDSRNLMIVCAVTLRKRSCTLLYTNNGNIQSGHSYCHTLSKIISMCTQFFSENVRNLDKISQQYIYDNDQHKPPTDPNEIELLEKIIKKLRIVYDPMLFSNPKLQVQLQSVEAQALDLEKPESPPDDTVPNIDAMRERNGKPPRKKVKKAAEATDEDASPEVKETIRKLVEEKKVDNVTVAELKVILRTLGLKTSGKKNDLIDRIKEYYN